MAKWVGGGGTLHQLWRILQGHCSGCYRVTAADVTGRQKRLIEVGIPPPKKNINMRYLAVHTSVCTAQYNYLAPAWPQLSLR
jgi:hypothetical protein